MENNRLMKSTCKLFPAGMLCAVALGMGTSSSFAATFTDANWISMGGLPGADGSVRAVVVDGSGNIYIGGDFTGVGEVIANHIAKWDGSSWSALGSGVVGSVNALAVSGTNLYVGGRFTSADGIAATNIVKWDGNTWSALGSGIGGASYPAVGALAVWGSDLYAVGTFTTAGGKASAYVARAIVNPPILDIAPDGFGGYFLSFSGVPGSPYRLQRAQILSGPWANSTAQIAPTSGHLEFWDVFPPPGRAFYRAIGP